MHPSGQRRDPSPRGCAVILVTGATGTVGMHLVPQLLEAGQRVRVLVRDPGRLARLGDRVDVAVGDLDAAETLADAMEDVRAVYLIAFETRQVSNVIAAAARAGVAAVVRQSTIEAGAEPPIGPGRWHREQESVVERSRLAWTHLRPTMMMSNTIQWWTESIHAQAAVFFAGGEGRVSPVDPADIAAAACAVLTQDGHTGNAYDVTGSELLTIPEMVQVLARVLGKPIRYVDMPEAAAAEGMRDAGLPEHVVGALVETLGSLRANRFAYVADTVERLTGRRPRSFEAWCRDHVDAFGIASHA